MPAANRTDLAEYLTEACRGRPDVAGLPAVLMDVAAACNKIAKALALGARAHGLVVLGVS